MGTQTIDRVIDGVRYRIARPEDRDAIWALMLHNFFPHVSVFAHLGYTRPADDTAQFTLSPGLLEQRVTVVAEDLTTGALIGARISGLAPRDSAKRHPLAVDSELAARYPIDATVFRAVDFLTTTVDLYDQYGVETALEFKFLMVQEEMRSRQIGKRLVEASLDLAKQLGVPVVSVMAAHHHTVRIFDSLGFDRLRSLLLPEYVDPVVGDRPFEGLDPSVLQEFVLYAKRL